MMKKVSIKSIKLPITKRNHRQQIAQDKVGLRENGDFENKDEEADLGHADHGLKQRNATSGTTVDKASRKGKTSFLKCLRKKLVSRHRPRETSEPIPEDTEIAFNSMSGNKGSKQTKSKGQNMRSVCPMPSPVRSTNMSGNKTEDEFQKSVQNSTNSEASSNSNHSRNGSGSSSSLECTTRAGDHAQAADRSHTTHVEKLEPEDVGSTTSPGSINASFENQQRCNGESISQTGCITYESCEIGQHALTPMYDSVIETPKMRSLTRELFKLSNCGWYWGPITRVEAEEKLSNQADGAFLVRDSSDDRYLLSLSFRSYGKTLHTRIEHCNGMFSFYAQSEPEGHSSIVDLIEHSMNYSQSGVFCYSRARMPGSPSFPVRLTKPISRFTQVRSLQYLCRFVIRLYIRRDNIEKLPLPSRIKGYIEEGHY